MPSNLERHDVRNRGEYEGDLQITERLVTDLIEATGKVADKLADVSI